jgi:hypothetical protein
MPSRPCPNAGHPPSWHDLSSIPPSTIHSHGLPILRSVFSEAYSKLQWLVVVSC